MKLQLYGGNVVWGHPPHGRATKQLEHWKEIGCWLPQFLQPCGDEQPDPEHPLLSKESNWVNWPENLIGL